MAPPKAAARPSMGALQRRSERWFGPVLPVVRCLVWFGFEIGFLAFLEGDPVFGSFMWFVKSLGLFYFGPLSG